MALTLLPAQTVRSIDQSADELSMVLMPYIHKDRYMSYGELTRVLQ